MIKISFTRKFEISFGMGVRRYGIIRNLHLIFATKQKINKYKHWALYMEPYSTKQIFNTNGLGSDTWTYYQQCEEKTKV